MGVRRQSVTANQRPTVERAVFFDRDGVINKPIVRNRRPYPPARLEDFVWMDGIPETLNALSSRGYLILVFTNQPDVARGTQTEEGLAAFHRRILDELPVAKVYACLHDDADECACRKPRPGMLLAARADYHLDLAQCWAVGDRWRDIEAGRAAGCRTVLVQHNYDERRATADYEIDQITQLLDIIE